MKCLLRELLKYSHWFSDMSTLSFRKIWGEADLWICFCLYGRQSYTQWEEAAQAARLVVIWRNMQSTDASWYNVLLVTNMKGCCGFHSSAEAQKLTIIIIITYTTVLSGLSAATFFFNYDPCALNNGARYVWTPPCWMRHYCHCLCQIQKTKNSPVSQRILTMSRKLSWMVLVARTFLLTKWMFTFCVLNIRSSFFNCCAPYMPVRPI